MPTVAMMHDKRFFDDTSDGEKRAGAKEQCSNGWSSTRAEQCIQCWRGQLASGTGLQRAPEADRALKAMEGDHELKCLGSTAQSHERSYALNSDGGMQTTKVHERLRLTHQHSEWSASNRQLCAGAVGMLTPLIGEYTSAALTPKRELITVFRSGEM